MRRQWPWAVALALMLGLLGVGRAIARPWRVDDLFHLQDIGQAEFSPDGRYLLVERLRPRAQMTRFDMDNQGEVARSEPLVFDLASGGPPHALLPSERGCGYALGAVSPDGRRVVVYRLRGRSYTLGVVELGTGHAQWFDLTPELGRWGQTVAWLSPSRLAAVIRSDRTLPLEARMAFEAPDILSKLSRDQDEGRRPSVSVVGSGRYLDLRPRAAPDRLVTLDLATRAVRVLAAGGFFDLSASHDRRFVALLSNDTDLQYPESQLLHVGTPATRRSLTLVDLETGRVSRPAHGFDLLSHLLAWAPSVDRLLVYGREGDEPWTAGKLLVVDAPHDVADARSGVSAQIVEDVGGIPVVQADWEGVDPLLYGHLPGQPAGRSDWFKLTASGPLNMTHGLPASPSLLAVGAEGLLFHAGDGFWRIDALGGATRLQAPTSAAPLTLLSPDQGARFVFNERPRRDWIWIRTQDGNPESLQRLGAKAAPRVPVAAAAGVLAADGVSDQVATLERDAHGVQTLSLERSNAFSRQLLRLNADLGALDPAVVRPVTHLVGDGTKVTSWLYLPPGLKAGARPPLVVWAYPGEAYPTAPEFELPGVSAVPSALGNAQVLAGGGYAVLVASLPLRTDLADPADGFEPDILRAVDAAGATGLVDTGRLALWGHSYGGYAALEVASRSSRFRAIIASAAVTDMASVNSVFSPFIRMNPADGLWIDSRAGWLEEGQARLHTQAWVDPLRYVKDSPVFSAGAIGTPILMISGSMDPVPPEQREEMFSDLYRQGKSAILATYFGEGHLIYSPANLQDMYARIFKFLDENLGPTRAPGGA